MKRSTPDAERFEQAREVSGGAGTGAEDDRRWRLNGLPFRYCGLDFLLIPFRPGPFRLLRCRFWGSSSKVEDGFRRMGEEVKKVRLSYVRGRKDVILLQGQHRFDPR